jgi:hypothetical protein
MRTVRTTLLASCIVFASSLPGFCLSNLISDGGFESPITGPGGLNSGFIVYTSGSTIAGVWSVSGPPPLSEVALVPSSEYTTFGGSTIFFTSQEGNQNLDLSGDYDTGGAMAVQQTFPTIAGHTYSLSFYVGAVTTSDWDGYAGSGMINVQLNGNPLLSAVNSDASGDAPTWKQFNTTFVAAGSSSTLAFISATPGGRGFNGLDNVVVNEVPEPGTCSLLAVGAALMLARRTRQSRRA